MGADMIVIGYQGIGKSSLCEYDVWSIDLESSIFPRDNADWFKIYCGVAEFLSKKYDVYVSSHKVVRDELVRRAAYNKDLFLVLVYPSLNLKDEWIEKLKLRYDDNPIDKNYKAYINAKETYDETIKELMEYPISTKIELDSVNYNLMDLIFDIEPKYDLSQHSNEEV